MTGREDEKMRDEAAEAAFDERVRSAYESVELSEEAQDRMLGALLAAQAEREVTDSAAERPAAEVLALPRRRSWAWVALPAAACLAIALFVGTRAAAPSFDAAPAADAKLSEEALMADSAQDAAAPATSADGADVLEIALADGRAVRLDTGDAGELVEVDPSLVGAPLGDGVALMSDGAQVACEAFEVGPEAGEPGAHCAVRLDGDDAFYLATLA